MTKKTSLINKTARNLPKAPCLFRREEGQSALEFVLVLPVFVAAFLLMVDLGMLMYQYVSVSNAVREGARFGSINCGDGSCTDDEVKTRIIDRSGGILSDPTEVQVDWMDNEPFDGFISSRGDSVVVRVNHPYNFLFLPFTIDVVSCADMSLEQADQTAILPATATGC